MRKRVQLIALLCAVILLVLCSPALVYDFAVHYQARSLIRVLKTIQVGRTTGRDAVRMMERFGVTAIVIVETVSKNSSTTSWHDVPLSTCVAGDCDLQFYVEPVPGWKTLRDLWCTRSGFRRWVPMNAMYGYLTIKHSVVQELQVQMGSIDEEIQHSASLHISGEDSPADLWNTTPWSIRKVKAHTHGPGRWTSEIRVGAWASAPQDRMLRAFDFDTSCLWLGIHCSRCQILPSACEMYDHGDWYEFDMPEEALAKFRQAVNNLKLGTHLNAVYDQLGNEDGFNTAQRLRDNTALRLRDLADNRGPFKFPQWTILEDEGRITYYVKKWRLDWGSPRGPDDRSVTFVLDKDLRLQRIESQVEGIPSRP